MTFSDLQPMEIVRDVCYVRVAVASAEFAKKLSLIKTQFKKIWYTMSKTWFLLKMPLLCCTSKARPGSLLPRSAALVRRYTFNFYSFQSGL